MFEIISQSPIRCALAAFAGIAAFPVAVSALPTRIPSLEEPATEINPASSQAEPGGKCLEATLCEVKNRVRWRTPQWKPEFCQTIAHAIQESASRHKISPALIVAIMINESDLNEKATRATFKNNTVYAMDGGLMGIRCVLDRRNRCTNGHVRGMTFSQVMDPVTNIELGARQLAHYRHGGGVTTVTVRVRDANGQLRLKQKNVTCTHRNHAYWAHYNHGPRYIDRGSARHYPHRIAVLYYAIARAMNTDIRELTRTRITMSDPGRRLRTPERPIGYRYKKLCQTIRDIGQVCGEEPKTALSALPPAIESSAIQE